MAGHRICSINLITNYWTEECLPQTIAEWVGCGDDRHNTDDNQMVVDIPDADVMGPVVNTPVIILISMLLIGAVMTAFIIVNRWHVINRPRASTPPQMASNPISFN